MSTVQQPDQQLPPEFRGAFTRLKQVVSPDHACVFASTTLQDVWTEARKIERELEQRNLNRGLHRIEPFLNGLQKYSDAIGVLCQGTPYLPWIWAPIILLLQLAQGHITAFEKLIEAYAAIGEAMPRFDRLTAAFKDHADFREVAGQFYSDILQFHRRAYKYFNRKSWKILIESLWKDFDKPFNTILSSLREHRDLVDREAQSIDIVEARDWRRQQLEQICQSRREREQSSMQEERCRKSQQVAEVSSWLGANELQEDIVTRLVDVAQTSIPEWILKEPGVVAWLSVEKVLVSLWLNGKPGAGKSVLCAHILTQAQKLIDTPTLYYFSSPHMKSERPLNDLLRSLVTQFLVHDNDFAPYILENFIYLGQRPSNKNLEMILENMIKSAGSSRIIADGLDEFSQDCQDSMFGWLLKLQSKAQGTCKLLISSRRSQQVMRRLNNFQNICLEEKSEYLEATINAFVAPTMATLRNTFDHSLVDELQAKVIRMANGMMLWVKLVLSILENMYTEEDLLKVLETLPDGLTAMYERILSRIHESNSPATRQKIFRILQWLLVAQRPLRKFEIEAGIVFEPGVTGIDDANRIRGDIILACSPLVDIEDGPDGYVGLVHFTATDYLVNMHESRLFRQPTLHMTVVLACLQYLATSYEILDPGAEKSYIFCRLLKRHHDLHNYAQEYWYDHLQAYFKHLTTASLTEAGRNDVTRALTSTAKAHHTAISSFRLCHLTQHIQVSTLSSMESAKIKEMSTDALVQEFLFEAVMSQKLEHASGARTSERNSERNSSTLFTFKRQTYQDLVELLLSDESSNIGLDATLLAAFRSRHGAEGYTCRTITCPRFSRGFPSADKRDTHEKEHKTQLRCKDSTCASFGWIFPSKSSLSSHVRRYHTDNSVSKIPNKLDQSANKREGSGHEPSPSFLGSEGVPRQHELSEQSKHPKIAGLVWDEGQFIPNTFSDCFEAFQRIADRKTSSYYKADCAQQIFDMYEGKTKTRLITTLFCIICHIGCPDSNFYRDHMIVHFDMTFQPPRSLNCQFCGSTFRFPLALSYHFFSAQHQTFTCLEYLYMEESSKYPNVQRPPKDLIALFQRKDKVM